MEIYKNKNKINGARKEGHAKKKWTNEFDRPKRRKICCTRERTNRIKGKLKTLREHQRKRKTYTRTCHHVIIITIKTVGGEDLKKRKKTEKIHNAATGRTTRTERRELF